MSVWHRFLPLLVLLALAGPDTCSAEADDRRSGFDFMGPQTQAMQSDDTSNPGMLAVLEYLHAVDKHILYANRQLVWVFERGAVSYGLRIEHDHIGKHAWLEKAAMIEPKICRR